MTDGKLGHGLGEVLQAVSELRSADPSVRRGLLPLLEVDDAKAHAPAELDHFVRSFSVAVDQGERRGPEGTDGCRSNQDARLQLAEGFTEPLSCDPRLFERSGELGPDVLRDASDRSGDLVDEPDLVG